MPLTQWGWSPELEEAFRPYEGTLSPARVVRVDRTGYLVVHTGGEVFARLAGHEHDDPPAVGDWIALDPASATIAAILPRHGTIARQAAGRESRAQVLAANVDVLLVVAGLDGDLNLRRLQRYLILGAASKVPLVVVLNKADVHDAPEKARAQVEALGVRAILVSATTGAGLDALRALIPPGVTAALMGSSGVGKSSLANRLLGEEALETGALRKKDKKGRHTTSARYLLPVPGGGVLLDTPGMREVALWDAEEGVAEVFADIEALVARCKFRNCAHDTEPGCAVRDGVTPERLAQWRKLQREAASLARRADVAAERKQGRAWGKMGTAAMQGKRERLRE